MRLRNLIKSLEKQVDHDIDVEFIVCVKDSGQIIAMSIERNAADLSKALKLFSGNPTDAPGL